MKPLEETLQAAKHASFDVARLSSEKKTAILVALAERLRSQKDTILAANKRDIDETQAKGKTGAFIDRLTLSENGFAGMLAQLETVARLPDPVGEKIEERTLPNGILLQKMRFPIGVVLMIYESRPNVTIDVAGLCLMSGNAVILKGGSEAINTNNALVSCIHDVLSEHEIPEAAVTFLENVTHQDVEGILKRNDLIDVVIPRGSYALTTAVAEQSRIPILYHAAGGARMYVDKSADANQALEICVNSKTNRTGVCNALDAVLVHKDLAEAFLPQLDAKLAEKGFASRADAAAMQFMPHAKEATSEDFSTEFLDTILAVKVVADSTEALDFIKDHSHHHTEVLAATDQDLIQLFIREIDAAGLMINCASRLHDGGELGMGAEMGTATGKLHARGPVGVKELTTYKWIAFGNGQLKQ